MKLKETMKLESLAFSFDVYVGLQLFSFIWSIPKNFHFPLKIV